MKIEYEMAIMNKYLGGEDAYSESLEGYVKRGFRVHSFAVDCGVYHVLLVRETEEADEILPYSESTSGF